MSKTRPMASEKVTDPSQPRFGQLRSWTAFWFTPMDPLPLHGIRVLAGLVFLAWLLPLAGHVDAFFSLNGWFDRRAYSETVHMPGGPPQPISWSVLYLAGNSTMLIWVIYWASIAVLLLYTLGLFPRLTAVLAWLAVASFTANPAIAYDADLLLNVLAFYVMVGYVLTGQRDRTSSWLARLLGPRDAFLFTAIHKEASERTPSLGANLAVRLLQAHFAIVMVVSGVHKLQFADWWSGVALWYPLHPPFQTSLEDMRVLSADAHTNLTTLSLAAYLVLAWQIGFPLFAWNRRLRLVLVLGAAVGWIGMAYLYRLPLFGPLIFVSCLGYLTPDEWQRWTTRVVARPLVWLGQMLRALGGHTSVPRNSHGNATNPMASRTP